MEQLGVWGEMILKLAILFAGIYVIIRLTPKLAAFIDKRRKNGEDPDEPRPERVQDDENRENSGENAVKNDNNESNLK